MKILIFTACESFSVDNRTNRLSLFHLVDSVGSPSFPFVLPALTFVSWMEKNPDEPTKGQAKIRLKVAGKTTSTIPLDYNFQNKLRTRAIVEVSGIVVDQMGKFEAELMIQDRVVSKWGMSITSIGATKVESSKPEATDTAKKATRKKAVTKKKN